MKFFKILDKFLAQIIIWLIKIYQKTISPDHSHQGKSMPFSGCKFYPSCSEYGILTLKKKGFLFGFFPMVWRVLRCHPWSRGGINMP